MKAFKDTNNQIRLFRPLLNMNRLRHSCRRLTLPDFSSEELLLCLKELLKIEHRWVPAKDQYSLYLRPNAIAFNSNLGIRVPNETLLYICCSPVGPYYPTGFKAVNLLCENSMIRAAPGGSGNYKLGSNYGPTIMPSRNAEIQGFNQILWLY
jgi:branched-chain amino acid aminotransferase